MSKKNTEITYKEIYQQTSAFVAINDTLGEICATLDKVFATKYDEVIFTGCGTSLYLAQTAAFVFSDCTNYPTRALPCSELFYFAKSIAKDRRVLVVPITRKSYTTEVRMAIDKANSLPNVSSMAITCDIDSNIYNNDILLSPNADEKSVIMTSSFTSMVYLASVMALYVGGKKDELAKMTSCYKELSDDLLAKTDALAKKIMGEHNNLNLFITLGQGANYGIANECMNKIKEMGISNSEAYYTLEYRHGPMSLVDENTLIVLLTDDISADYDVKLLDEMKSYGATTVAIGENVASLFPNADYVLNLDAGMNSIQYAAVIGYIGQFLGCYIAELKGIDADSPRHLSQAIVIEN